MSKDIKCRKWTLKSHFSGLPKREDLEIVEEQLPELKDGGRYRIKKISTIYKSKVQTLVSITNVDNAAVYALMQLYGTPLHADIIVQILHLLN